MASFLTVITRHVPQRAALLAFNRASLAAQSDPDYQHIVLVDEEARGLEYAQRMLLDALPAIEGRYVLILDDDNVMLHHEGIALIKWAAEHDDPAIMMRGWYGRLGLLPEPSYWRKRPAQCHVGSFGYALRADIFKQYAHIFAGPEYYSDFLMIDAVFADGHRAAWVDSAICAVTQIGMGEP
jgi:hypothetical protein